MGTRMDEEEEFMFTGGRRDTVIDYVIEDEKIREKVGKLTIGERIDLDHHPVEVLIKGEKRGEKGIKGGREIVEWNMK